jgi:hypothetical protein
MIEDLVDLLPNFPGPTNRCQCFLHIVNLVAKTLLKQFEVPKKDMNAAFDAAEKALLELSTGMDMEEMVTIAEGGLGDGNDADDIEGWVNKIDELSEEESEELRQKIQPVRLVLVKVKNHCCTPMLMAAAGSSESSPSKSSTQRRNCCRLGMTTSGS